LFLDIAKSEILNCVENYASLPQAGGCQRRKESKAFAGTLASNRLYIFFIEWFSKTNAVVYLSFILSLVLVFIR
jgi:hypothetical protein